METLTEQDLDWLTKVENRLLRMRKREAANTDMIVVQIERAIEEIHRFRGCLQIRFGVNIDDALNFREPKGSAIGSIFGRE